MRRLIPMLSLLGALFLAGCDGCRPIGPPIPHCPRCPCLDLGEPLRDMSVPPDLSAPPDLSTPADMSCQGVTQSCVAPLRCCPGLDCVGGACAAVRTDL